jgi:hypothetical protein
MTGERVQVAEQRRGGHSSRAYGPGTEPVPPGTLGVVATHDIESVEVDRSSHVEVLFDDGLLARFELGPLRLACPCADCNAKRTRGQSVQPAVERGDAITVTHAELSG